MIYVHIDGGYMYIYLCDTCTYTDVIHVHIPMWPDRVQTMSSPVRMTGTRTVLWKGMKRETTAMTRVATVSQPRMSFRATLALHAADVHQSAFGLVDVAPQHQVLLVEAEQFQVVVQQGELDVGAVRGGLQGGDAALQVGPADGIFQASAFVERLGEVHGVVL